MAQNNLAPRISIREIDRSQITVQPAGTNVFLAGFTPQGPSDEPFNVSSLSEFEEVFGLPETPAEKYSHNAVKQLLETSPAAVTFTRMPYGSGAGIGYSDSVNALIFPVIGVSAVEIDPCDYFREVDETNCRINFPWLVSSFTPQAVCFGSSNLNCPLNSLNESANVLYIHDHPAAYDSIVTGFKFVVDDDSVAEDMKIFQLRPTLSGSNTNYRIVTAFSLSSIPNITSDENQSNLSNDGKRLIANLENTSFTQVVTITANSNVSPGLTSIGPNTLYVTANTSLNSGSALSGIFVKENDVFATYSFGDGVLKYFNASADLAGRDVAGSYRTSYTVLSSLSTGSVLTVTTSAVQATTQDSLIEFCAVPIEAGLSCETILELGLQVPEKDRYDFYPLIGDAQLNDANFYVLGAPISKSLNATEYELLKNEQFNWKCGVNENVEPRLDVVNNDVRAGIVVVNELKTAQLEDFTGYYLALNDNLNVNPNTDFDDITAVAGYYQELCPGVSGEWIQVPEERWNFKVSETFDGTAGSISEITENGGGINFGTKSYNDSLIVSLFKLRPTRLTETINKLDQILIEQFTGSVNADRKVNDEYGGPPRSAFIENTVNNGSNYLKVLVNPYLSKNNCWNDNSGVPQKTVRMFRQKTASVFDSGFDGYSVLEAYADKLFGVGAYNGHCRDELFELCQKKDIGNMVAKLERSLRNVENPLEFPIDLTVDAGLSTIWATREAVKADHCITDPSICYHFDDTYFVDTDSLTPYDGTNMASKIGDAWEVVYNVFDSFARFTRKSVGGVGHLHIQDPLRQIFVNGKDYKVVQRQKGITLDPATGQPTEKYATFSRNIWAPLRNLYAGTNSNFSESHANWIKSYDANTDSMMWFGPSAYKAALFARNDSNQFPWTAALGLSNGQLANIVDIAINPNQREMDLLTKIGLNPIVRFPNSGYVVWNTLTLQKEQSALQENYVRRGLLWLANAIQENVREFIGKPNTIITRTRTKNKITPICQYMKDNEGVYAYQVICDERNNTNESVDRGELRIAVYVQPTRTVKQILVDIIVDRTGVTSSVVF
jgi:hypothetical protein